jgi:hypothetical protein
MLGCDRYNFWSLTVPQKFLGNGFMPRLSARSTYVQSFLISWLPTHRQHKHTLVADTQKQQQKTNKKQVHFYIALILFEKIYSRKCSNFQ